MDIKLRRYNHSKAWSVLAFVLCVVFFVATLTTGAMALKSVSLIHGNGADIDDVLFYPSYKESAKFQWEFQEKASEILYLIEKLKGEDYIKSGQSLDQNLVENRIRSLFYDKAANDESLYEKYGDYYEGNASGRERFEADYADEIDQIKQELILDSSELQRQGRLRTAVSLCNERFHT